MEHIAAAHWANYKFFDEFLDLPVEKQTIIVAAYRTEKQIDAVLAWKNRPKRKPKKK